MATARSFHVGRAARLVAVSLAITAGAVCASDYGLDAYRSLELLPRLRIMDFAQGASSFDRSGGNADRGQFLYFSGSERVMADVSGPGVLYRLWTTGQNNGNRLRVYLDGAATPAINHTFSDFYGGVTNPFLAPLNASAAYSSGGFYSYLPLTFTNGCRITSSDASLYFNCAFILAPGATNISSWTGAEDSSDVRALWQNAGEPCGTYSDTRALTTSVALAPGAAVTLAGIAGPRVIHSLRMLSDDIVFTTNQPGTITDDGRAFNNYSQFVMALDASNSGARLVRRLDASVGWQKANVYVDGTPAGEFYSPFLYPNTFYDGAFDISNEFTAGKNAVTVRVQFVSSNFDWNEFHYWMYSTVGSTNVLTDTLDVGASSAALASEAAHSYTIAGATWEGVRTFKTFDAAPVSEPYSMTGLWLQASWDGHLTNAIDAPLGFFFGMPFGARHMASLMTGMRTNDNMLYSYFPMPFESHGQLVITNCGGTWVSNLWCEVRHAALPGEARPFGYFHATYRSAPVVSGVKQDYVFLDTAGCGHFAGVIHSMFSPSGSKWYLEGDEHFYVDGSPCPVIHGTGTEDYYNGGWYFEYGIFALPTHGNPNYASPNGADRNACYRLHVPDVVPFRTHLRASIEFGGYYDANATYASVAYWYGVPEPAMVQTDTIEVGDTTNEAARAFVLDGTNTATTLSAAYPGAPETLVSDSGRYFKGTNSFAFAFDAARGSVLLRRRADFYSTTYAHQAVDVLCNGRYCGAWRAPGYTSSSTMRWRDDTFVIPYTALPLAPSATVTLVSHPNRWWSAFRYDVFSLDDVVVPEPAAGVAFLLQAIMARAACCAIAARFRARQ